MGKKENNVVSAVETGAPTMLATLAGAGLSGMLSSLGYEYQTTSKDENGATDIVLKDAENGGTFEQALVLKDTEYKALATLRELQGFDTMKRIVVAWKCYELKQFATNNGFKSVGELVEMNVKGLSALTVNQYARVAELFLTLPEGTDVPAFKYEWCRGVSITNLVQCLSLVKKSGSPESFYEDYIATDKLHLRATLSTLKGDIDTVNGKSKSKSKSKSENESENENKVAHPVMSYATMFASLSEHILSNNGVPENVLVALSTIGEYLESTGTIKTATATESESESESESK